MLRPALFSLCSAALVAQAPLPMFEASAPAVVPGQSVALKWNWTEVAKVRLEPGGLVLPASGSLTVAPAGTTEYVMSEAKPGGRVLGRLTVRVDPAAALGEPARICRFDASARAVPPGEPVTLKWTCTGTAKVRLEPGGMELDGQTEVTVTPLESTRYVLSAANAAGGATQSLEIHVVPKEALGQAARTCLFVADKPVVRPGEPVELRWDCQGAAQVRLEPGGLQLDGKDRVTVTPMATTVYTLSVSNLAGGLSRSLEVRVESPAGLGAGDRARALREGDLAAALQQGRARRAELPKGAWTLRLLVSGRADGIRDLHRLAAGREGDLLVLPYVRKDGLRWWQACCGGYRSRAEAMKAWASLPAPLRKAVGQPLPLRLDRLPGDPPQG